MQVRARLMCLALFALVIPSFVAAQDATPLAPQPVPTAGPTMASTATAFRAVADISDHSAVAMQRRQPSGKPAALMIVGGAAILIGAVIGDEPGTLFMVGGAVALLYGLYLYLR